jgi:hypothetical protein
MEDAAVLLAASCSGRFGLHEAAPGNGEIPTVVESALGGLSLPRNDKMGRGGGE